MLHCAIHDEATFILSNVKMQIQLTPPMSANKPANSPGDPEIKLKESELITHSQVSTEGQVISVGVSRSGGGGSSVCQRAQDEETILLLPDPLQQFVDSRDGHRLGPQRTEAEVELETISHLRVRLRRDTGV